MSNQYVKTTDQLRRSYSCMKNSGETGNPWKLLAAAIIFQAAADCQSWTPEIEKPCYSYLRDGIRYLRRDKLIEFINSDWIDLLLCWQNEIKPEAVCEELVKRLETAQYRVAKQKLSSVYGVMVR